MLAYLVYWTFQVVNGLASLGMSLSPQKTHESLFANPQQAYSLLGFSSATAVEMVHNVLRGQGVALLAVSVYLFVAQGPQDPNSFLLIALVCGFSALAHVATLRHHRGNPVVMKAVGPSLSSLYVTIAVNLVVGGAAALVYILATQK